MKIAIDIDDTLTNTKDNQIKLWKEYYNRQPKVGFSEQLPSDINEFDADEYIGIFWNTYREQLSFNSTYKKDASTIIDKLKNDGHELCIVTSRPDDRYENLKERIANIVIAYNYDNEPVTVRDLGCEGVITLILKDAPPYSLNYLQYPIYGSYLSIHQQMNG